MGFLWDSPIFNPPVPPMRFTYGVSMGFPHINASNAPFQPTLGLFLPKVISGGGSNVGGGPTLVMRL